MADGHAETDGWGGLACMLTRRVLAVWHAEGEAEKRCLGCLVEAADDDEGRHADCKGRLSLEIHRGDGANPAALVKFHLPVRLPASKSRQPKDMYVVLPASSLSMTRVRDDAVPANVRRHIPSAMPYSHIRLGLRESSAPYALMPEIQRRPKQIGRRVTGTARRMIICLQSLCKARSWDVFVVGDSAMESRVDDACQLLGTGGISEPKLNLWSIYADGIRGLVNHWEDYPYYEDERRTRRDLSPVPPCYSEIAEDRQQVSPASDQLYWKTSQPPIADPAGGSCEPPTAQDSVAAKRKKAEADSSSDDRAAIHKQPRGATTAPASAPGPGAPFAIFERQLAVAQELSPTEEDSVSLDDRAENDAILGEQAEGLGPATPPHVAQDSASQYPQPSFPSALAEPGHESARHSPPARTPGCHTEEGRLHFQMVYFLLYALSRDGDALVEHMGDLLEMGRRVNQQNGEAFRAIRHRCFRRLSARAVRHTSPVQLTLDQMRSQANELLYWLDDAISEEAYPHVDLQFAGVQEVVSKAGAAGADGHVRKEFEIRRADFYAAAFRVADGVEGRPIRRPPVLCADCVARLSRMYSSFV